MATGITAVQTIDVVTPAAGESVTEGTILEWRVKVGEPIKVDDTIVEISTDKVDVELPSPASGTVSEILAEPAEPSAAQQPTASQPAAPAAAKRPAAAPAQPADGATVVPDGTKVSPV